MGKNKNQISYQLPNFLGIGAQKAGTTWLHEMLKQHPEVFLPKKRKELMFFDTPKNYKQLGVAGYKRFFQGSQDYKAIGEITPGYLWSSEVYSDRYEIPQFRFTTPERVYNTLGSQVKLIVILRDPVKRAISAYMHHINKNRIKDWENILNVGKKHGIIHMGFYYAHLSNWMKYFNRDNFLIVTYEWLFQEQSRLAKVFDFLNVESQFIPTRLDKKYNVGLLYKSFQGEVYVDLNSVQNNNNQDNENNNWLRVVDRHSIETLREIYKEDVEKLRNHLEIDTEPWSI
jgi:hypothetical protein